MLSGVFSTFISCTKGSTCKPSQVGPLQGHHPNPIQASLARQDLVQDIAVTSQGDAGVGLTVLQEGGLGRQSCKYLWSFAL